MPRERESPGLRRARPGGAIEERAAGEDMAPAVSAPRRVRGIPAATAFSIAAEIGNFSRFPDARSSMSFVGLVPSEPSGGESVSRGRIARTGSIHVRTLLVEAVCLVKPDFRLGTAVGILDQNHPMLPGPNPCDAAWGSCNPGRPLS
jgi:hypothetical protein